METSILPLWQNRNLVYFQKSGISLYKFAFIQKNIPEIQNPFVSDIENTDIKKFLLFLCLLVEDTYPIICFENGTSQFSFFQEDDTLKKFLEKEKMCSIKKDKKERIITFEQQIFCGVSKSLGQLNLRTEYNKFLENTDHIDQVKLLLSTFSVPFSNTQLRITDVDSIRLFLDLLIIEKYCFNDMQKQKCSSLNACCISCKKESWHYVNSTKIHRELSLRKKLRFSNNIKKKYLDLVLNAFETHRNKFAHVGKNLPIVSDKYVPVIGKPHTRITSTEYSINNRDIDSLNRLNYMQDIHYIARLLLLQELFPIAIRNEWPENSSIKQYRSI